MTRFAILLFTVAAMAQTNRTHATRVWFRDGTCIEIHTEASGNAPLFAGGSVQVDISNTMQRLVLDDHDHALFGYDVEAHAARTPGMYAIRIRPLDAARPLPAGVFVAAGGHIPTLGAVREFSSVKSGEALMVDILYNPATNEKIYDVLRPITAVDDTFNLDGAHVLVNGVEQERVSVRSSQGSGVLLHLPGKGDYFLSLDPLPGYPFEQTARVEGDRLILGDIEIRAGHNILMKKESRAVWVYRRDAAVADVTASLQRMEAILKKQQQIEALRSTYTSEHPTVKALNAQLEQLQAAPKDFVLVQATDDLAELIRQRRKP